MLNYGHLITSNLQTSTPSRHGGGHIPTGARIGNASNPPSLSNQQPIYTQPVFQGTTQYASSYVSSQSTSPQPSTGRHGGGHVPQGSLTSQQSQQNHNFTTQQPYVPQYQQTYAPYGQVPRGGTTQGYALPEATGYAQQPQSQPQPQPQVRHSNVFFGRSSP
jgi:hypothetical protein